MVDATYKLTNLRMPVYLMLCIDGNGQSEIVACCVTSLETEDGMTAMANAFKKHNSRWDQVAMVMTDKDSVWECISKCHNAPRSLPCVEVV